MNFHQITLEEALRDLPRADEPPLPSFSKIVIEQARKDQVIRHCPTCHHEERIYRRTLRPCFIPALRILMERGPMKTSQLFEYFSDRPGLAAAIARHVAETRHWGFVTQTEDGHWVTTRRAREFLRGQIQVHRKVWPRDAELPEECVDEEMVWVDDIRAEDFSDKDRHLAESVSLPPSP